MTNLVNRNEHNLFKKRHYVNIIKTVAKHLAHHFGYKNVPFLKETKAKKGELMSCFRLTKNHAVIFYDYMQFKRQFDGLDFDTKEAYTAFFIAHEMRHYYQFRQLDSKTPTESKETLDAWRENDENYKCPEKCKTIFELCMQPLEIDAMLFAYLYVAHFFNARVSLDYIGENYINELEKYYVKRFGETDEILFPANE